VLSDDESLLLFRGLHILGGARDRESCQPLLRLLRRPLPELNDLLGDAITESMAKIVTGVFDGDIDGLFALMIDSSIDMFIREASFGAAMESRRRDAGRSRPQCAVIQARASRWAAAISTSDIISATSRRREIASARPFSAARLNHLWAATRLTTPERPLAQ